MPEKNTITLVVVCDDHYVILMAALIRSIEENLSPGVCVGLWIIDDGITEENKRKTEASVNAAITTLHWHKIGDVIKDAPLPKDHSSYPLNIYARLFIADLIPAGTEKVLYLDVDMIVVADLYRLWSTDIADHTIAAVMDPRVQTFDNDWGGIKNYKALNLQAKSKYFNTGLLLINTRKWREDGITAKVVNTINGNLKYANYPDQYGLNIVLAGQWRELEARWNVFVTDEVEDPYLIHFVGRKPIYKAYRYSATYKELFFSYLKKTEWRDAEPISEYRRGIKKIKNILSKMRTAPRPATKELVK